MLRNDIKDLHGADKLYERGVRQKLKNVKTAGDAVGRLQRNAQKVKQERSDYEEGLRKWGAAQRAKRVR
ncbi:MAG TPA: hypothetical protein VF076_05950 [Acidimicrobiales bacterium]